MRVGLTFDVPPGGKSKSEYLLSMLLMVLFSELANAGVHADHIAIRVDASA